MCLERIREAEKFLGKQYMSETGGNVSFKASPALLGPAWYVRVTDEDLCLGMVSRFALGPLDRPELKKKKKRKRYENV